MPTMAKNLKFSELSKPVENKAFGRKKSSCASFATVGEGECNLQSRKLLKLKENQDKQFTDFEKILSMSQQDLSKIQGPAGVKAMEEFKDARY